MIEYRVDFDMQEIARGYAKRLGAHLDEAVLDELEPTLNEMSWFKRKPCHDRGTYCFSCSECGWTANEPHHLFGGFQPNFCPNCGARVEDE